jgi:hypothetical protein
MGIPNEGADTCCAHVSLPQTRNSMPPKSERSLTRADQLISQRAGRDR